MQSFAQMGWSIKSWEKLRLSQEAETFKRKIFVWQVSPVSTTGKSIPDTACFADKTFSFISEDCAKKQKMAYPNDIVMAVTSEILRMFANVWPG